MHYEYLILLIIIIIIFIFLNKKLKKYTNIYHKDGLDGVWLYFYNKNIKKTGLSNLHRSVYFEFQMSLLWRIPDERSATALSESIIRTLLPTYTESKTA